MESIFAHPLGRSPPHTISPRCQRSLNWYNNQEEIIQVEFFEAMMPPEPATEIKEDDWVASVAGWQKGNFILSGSYDHHGTATNGLFLTRQLACGTTLGLLLPHLPATTVRALFGDTHDGRSCALRGVDLPRRHRDSHVCNSLARRDCSHLVPPPWHERRQMVRA